jgi:prepilin peptidase CpaA
VNVDKAGAALQWKGHFPRECGGLKDEEKVEQEMLWMLWLSVAVGLAASVEDLWRRRVSNVISLAALLGGLGLHAWLGGLSGVGDSLLGGVIGFFVFFVFFLMGGMGGGDVKLMAGFGAILGAEQTITAALMTALIGGLMAVGYLVAKKLWRVARGNGLKDGEADRKAFIPYAPAISLGVLLSFLSEEELWTNVC